MALQEEADIIAKTQEFWGKRTGRDFTPEDAREMVANVSQYFALLHDWDKKAGNRSQLPHTESLPPK